MSELQQEASRRWRRFSEEFKRDAVRLVVEEGYTFKAAVAQVHAASHGIYGSPKIAQALQEQGDLESACRNTVAAAMRELGLQSRVRKAIHSDHHPSRSDPRAGAEPARP